MLLGVIALSASAGVDAHDRKSAGPLELVIGWGDEPAFAGSRNSVVVSLSERGVPVKVAAGSLSVEITFGSERMTLPLEPAAGRPHEFRAWLVPTRAGTYTFHVTGTVNQQAVDVTTTCSDGTFHCVTDATDIQFPAKDPSVAQLAARLDRALPRAEGAGELAAGARLLAIAAIAISIAGVAAAMFIARRGRRPGV